jgi:hypothetical protein
MREIIFLNEKPQYGQVHIVALISILVKNVIVMKLEKIVVKRK